VCITSNGVHRSADVLNTMFYHQPPPGRGVQPVVNSADGGSAAAGPATDNGSCVTRTLGPRHFLPTLARTSSSWPAEPSA
jgi:hypothetical protein